MIVVRHSTVHVWFNIHIKINNKILKNRKIENVP